MKYPENIQEFMIWFKNQSELHFKTLKLQKDVFGLQHQKGTKWRDGLNDSEIIKFQNEVGFDFPEILIGFYKNMNGTNIPGINVFGNQGIEYVHEPIFFSYPNHIDEIKSLINNLLDIKGLTIGKMKENNIPFIFPISNFYFMIIDNKTNPIYFLSEANKNHNINEPYVYGSLWADTLQNFLVKNTLFQLDHTSDLEEFPNIIRETNYWDNL
jgi:hypothetical protein